MLRKKKTIDMIFFLYNIKYTWKEIYFTIYEDQALPPMYFFLF